MLLLMPDQDRPGVYFMVDEEDDDTHPEEVVVEWRSGNRCAVRRIT